MKYCIYIIFSLTIVFSISCGSEEPELVIGTILLTVDRNTALAGTDTVTITAEVLDETFAKVEGVPLTYWADDVQLASNKFIPTTSGIYILSARYNDVQSRIQKITVVSLDDGVDNLRLSYNGTNFLTTHPWSLSAKFSREVTLGTNTYVIDDNKIPLYLNGQVTTQFKDIHFDEAGTYVFHAELNGRRSSEISIEVRDPKSYEVTEIPIVFHLYGVDDIDLANIPIWTAYLNEIYNKESFDIEDVRKGTVGPNADNLFLRFRLEDKPPSNIELLAPGVNYVPLINDEARQPDLNQLFNLVTTHNWDPKKYINIWLMDGWALNEDDLNDFLVDQLRGLYTPPVILGDRVGGLPMGFAPSNSNFSFFAINSNFVGDHPDYILTTMGHYLGLLQVDEFGCIEEGDFLGDTHTRVDLPGNTLLPTGKMWSCKEYLYSTNNFMNINLNYTNFTYDQRERIREVLSKADLRPSLN